MEHKQHESLSNIRFPDGFRLMQGKREFVTYPEHSTLRVWYDETPGRFDNHCHSAVEIVLTVRGVVNYALPGREYQVRVGEALIIPPECVHSLNMPVDSARYLMLFEPDVIFSMRDLKRVPDVLNAPLYLPEMPEVQADAWALLNQLVQCYQKREPMWNSACYAMLLQMYSLLARHCLAAAPQGKDACPESLGSDVINSACLYIDQNCMRDITLEHMAAFSGFSKFYFSRVFSQQMGVTFSDYLRNRRIQLAEEMLIHTRKAVREIAAEAGFSSIATFNRVFREVRHCTPTQYREIYGLPE